MGQPTGFHFDAQEVAVHPTVAEQVAATRRRELREAAMMPYDTYRLHEAERPKTAAEIRAADERAGRLAAAVAGLVRSLLGREGRGRARDRAPVPTQRQHRRLELGEDQERVPEQAGLR
jgi:hypothetical protein